MARRRTRRPNRAFTAHASSHVRVGPAPRAHPLAEPRRLGRTCPRRLPGALRPSRRRLHPLCLVCRLDLSDALHRAGTLSRDRVAAHVGNGGRGARARGTSAGRRPPGERAVVIRVQASSLRRRNVRGRCGAGGGRPRRSGGIDQRPGRDSCRDDIQLSWGVEPVETGCAVNPEDRRRYLKHARDLFNSGEYWLAHEALETVWRSIIKEDEARVWQGLIQAAAALLHRARGNRHGIVVVGAAALEKLAGPQRPEIEFETVKFRAQLARALAGEGDPPRLEYRNA